MTGEGENIEAGLFETIVFWLSQHLAKAQITGQDAEPRGEGQASGMAKMMGWGVYRLFDTSDHKQIFIAVTSNRHWQALCEVLGFPDWRDCADFGNNRKRAARRPEIAERVQSVTSTRTFDEISSALEGANIPFAPVNTPMTLLQDRHLNEAGRWIDVSGAGHTLKIPKMPLSLEGFEFELRSEPPSLGQHTDEVLTDLGYDNAAIDRLKEQHIVLTSDRMLNIDGPHE